MRDPLILPAVAVASGIFLGRGLMFTRPESWWPIAAFGLLALANTRLRPVCVTFAWLCLGIFAEAWHRPGPPPEIDAGSRETMILEGCVVEPTVFSANREQFTLELDRAARARVSLNLRDGDPAQRLDYGQHIEIEARIRRPHNYNNPGSFDYAGYLARQNIFWTATMTAGSTARVLPGRCGSRFMSAVFALRVAALDRIEALYGTDLYSTGMMEAILIGETSKLEKIWTQSFRRTGTFHALVISGVHVTVLAGVLLFLLRICALPEIPALAITAAAAWIYALVSGFSAPVVRAAGGFTLYLVARFFFRRGRVLNLLAAVALVYLLWDPGQLFDASFVLSFLCVAAIGALAAPLLEATSIPYARGMQSIGDTEMDPLLAPRVAQLRVELRLAAETMALWLRIPQQWALAILAAAGRRGAVRVRDGGDLDRGSDRALAADGGIFPSRLVHRIDREFTDRAAVERGGAARIHRHFQRLEMGRGAGRRAVETVGQNRRLARFHRAGVARSGSAYVAGADVYRGTRGRGHARVPEEVAMAGGRRGAHRLRLAGVPSGRPGDYEGDARIDRGRRGAG